MQFILKDLQSVTVSFPIFVYRELEPGGIRIMQKSKEMELSDLDKKLLAMDPEVSWLYPAAYLI